MAKEGLSVQEAEHLVDFELFLEGQARWEEDSPHHLVILYEMFQHASEQGQKEAECMICRGHHHGLPKMGPKVDISAIQLVGPQTSREEFKSLYYEVYKLWRLLGSPPREPELVAEVLSSLEDCQGWEGGKMPWMTREPNPTYVWPLRSRTPRRGKRDASAEESCWGERGPPEGSGYGGCLGRNRVAEPPPHQEPVRGPSPFPKRGLQQM